MRREKKADLGIKYIKSSRIDFRSRNTLKQFINSVSLLNGLETLSFYNRRMACFSYFARGYPVSGLCDFYVSILN